MGMTQSNLIQFGLINDDEVDSSDNDIDSKSEPEKSEIDKMIEEDLSTTFHETAHLISSLSAQKTLKSVQYRLHEQHQQQQPQREEEEESAGVPSMDLVSQSLPVRFGTMFDSENSAGSLFGSTLPSV